MARSRPALGEPRPCEYCGTLFRPALINVRRGNGRFCGRPCVYAARATPPGPCSIDGCDRQRFRKGKGMCSLHYGRLLRRGETGPVGLMWYRNDASDGQKRCCLCGITKPISEFHRNAGLRDGLSRRCSVCDSAYGKTYRTTDRGRAVNAAWRRRYRERIRADARESRYNISPERQNEMLLAQGGICPICETPLTLATAHVDHDQSCCSGRTSCGQCVRGFLCADCNIGLGRFGDDPKRLQRAALYLR